jgi:RNA polymerase sigma factor (sigma-70 family)
MTLLDPTPGPHGPVSPTDAELIVAVRAGDRSAYGALYERHLAAARAHARRLTPSAADADDLVADAFAWVFSALRAGHGPRETFRAYLLTTVRNGLYQRARGSRRLELSDDMTRYDKGVPWSDPVEVELDSTLAARAFSALPARWQTVLWLAEVQRRSTADIGEQMGLLPSAVAALAYRAREGLRQAYLQAHVTDGPDEDCRPTVHRLGGWTRGRLAAGDAALVQEHLDGCDRCRRLAAELADVNGGLPGLAPLLVAAAASYSSAGAGALGMTASGAGGAGTASLLGWLVGTHAGQAAAVLTAVLVGGTAVVSGLGVPGHGPHGSSPAAVSLTGSGPVGSRPLRSAGPDPGEFRLEKSPDDGPSPVVAPKKTLKTGTARGKAKNAANGKAKGAANGKAKGAANGKAKGAANGKAKGAADGAAKGAATGGPNGKAKGKALGAGNGEAHSSTSRSGLSRAFGSRASRNGAQARGRQARRTSPQASSRVHPVGGSGAKNR